MLTKQEAADRLATRTKEQREEVAALIASSVDRKIRGEVEALALGIDSAVRRAVDEQIGAFEEARENALRLAVKVAREHKCSAFPVLSCNCREAIARELENELLR